MDSDMSLYSLAPFTKVPLIIFHYHCAAKRQASLIAACGKSGAQIQCRRVVEHIWMIVNAGAAKGAMMRILLTEHQAEAQVAHQCSLMPHCTHLSCRTSKPNAS